MVFVGAGIKIGTNEYLEILEASLLPWIESNFGLNNIVLVQDSAPAHQSRKTQQFLANKILFVKAEVWPSNSPDLNVLDYYLWGVLQQQVNKSSHSSIDSLKRTIKRELKKIPKDDVVAACKKFHSRIEAVIRADGGHIEQN